VPVFYLPVYHIVTKSATRNVSDFPTHVMDIPTT